jgi:dihydrofolate reductase
VSEQNSRRLVQAALVTLNGVIGQPATWAGPYFGPGTAEYSLAQLRDSAAFLMGRRTYEIFSRQWPGQAGPYAERLNSMPKYVFSSTLEEADWPHTTVVGSDVVEYVAELKSRPGKDLTFYGHGRFGQSLTDAGLVDQLTLTVIPVFVPDGKPLFQAGGIAQRWELVEAGPGADPGLARLTYRPRRDR